MLVINECHWVLEPMLPQRETIMLNINDRTMSFPMLSIELVNC